MINEVLYDAEGSDTGHEWVELFNQGDREVDVSGWRIERGGTAFASVATLPEGTRMSPQAFLLVGESSVEGRDVTATLAFQNGGSATDGIRVVDDDGDVVDVLLYDTPNTSGLPDETGSAGTSFAPDVAEGHSLARVPNGADTDASASDFVDTDLPTPGAPNAPLAVSLSPPPTAAPTPSPSPSVPQGILVNEVLPNPVGDDAVGEFIELWNSTGEALDLSGARLDDAEGGSTPYQIPAGRRVTPRGYLLFPRSETKIALNNDGDSARLLSPDGAVLSVLTYARVPREGAAWARFADGSGAWTLTPTPGVANILTPLAGNGEDEEEPSAVPRTRISPTPLRAKQTPTPPATPQSAGKRGRVSGVTAPTGTPLREASSVRSPSPPRGRASSGAMSSPADANRMRGEELSPTPAPGEGSAEAPSAPPDLPAPSRLPLLTIVLWSVAGLVGLVYVFLRRTRKTPGDSP